MTNEQIILTKLFWALLPSIPALVLGFYVIKLVLVFQQGERWYFKTKLKVLEVENRRLQVQIDMYQKAIAVRVIVPDPGSEIQESHILCVGSEICSFK